MVGAGRDDPGWFHKLVDRLSERLVLMKAFFAGYRNSSLVAVLPGMTGFREWE